MKRFLSVVFLVLIAAELAAQQQPPPPSAKDTRETSGATTQSNPVTTIRVPVNLVNVMFTVTDKKERMVLNLTKDDFRVLEDNQPQTITNFSRESNLPLRIAITPTCTSPYKMRHVSWGIWVAASGEDGRGGVRMRKSNRKPS